MGVDFNVCGCVVIDLNACGHVMIDFNACGHVVSNSLLAHARAHSLGFPASFDEEEEEE